MEAPLRLDFPRPCRPRLSGRGWNDGIEQHRCSWVGGIFSRLWLKHGRVARMNAEPCTPQTMVLHAKGAHSQAGCYNISGLDRSQSQ